LVMIVSVSARLPFEEILSAESLTKYQAQMDNRHIVFVGDSLMRYQYISLAYWLHTGAFPAHTPTILFKNNFAHWNAFYGVTNAMLYPAEYCDCTYQGEKVNVENRYYFNEKRNITLSFYSYTGDHRRMHGYWMPGGAATNHQFHAPTHETGPRKWVVNSIQELFTNIIAKLTPKPSVLLLNAGHWNNKYKEESHRTAVLTIALSHFDRVIWKTTNYLSDHQLPSTANDEACNYPRIECMNITWTKDLSQHEYMDLKHNAPEIYSDMNRQFMYQLVHAKVHPLVRNVSASFR